MTTPNDGFLSPNRGNATPLSHDPSPSPSGTVHHDNHLQQKPAGGLQRSMAFIHHWPTWGQWISDLWPDLLTFVIVGAAALAMNTVDAVGGASRKFIIWDEHGNFINPEIGKTRQANIIPIWLSALISTLIPIIIIVLSQIRVRSVYDVHVGVWGVAWSILLASLLQVFNKLLIGGIRPHFLDVCKPREDLLPGSGTGFHGLYFDKSICTGENARHINDALKSWPSGHTAVAFAGFCFASLYFNGKFKVFSDERPFFWKIVFFFLPPVGACLIAGAMVLDHSHHWYDVVGGGAIGILTALATYRANYASVWDFRFNHIPLPRPNSSWRPYPYHRPSSALSAEKLHKRSESDGHDSTRAINDIEGGGSAATSRRGYPPAEAGHHLLAATEMDEEYYDRGHFTYTTLPRDRFPDWAHGWGSGRRTWVAAGAPGDAAAIRTGFGAVRGSG